MSFANPWILLGLLGLGLPIAAHLLGRKEPTRIPFAAVQFLDANEPRVARRRQLHDRGLLALRLLLWAALIFALARPFSVEPAQLAVYGAPHDAVLVLDTSASMQLRDTSRSTAPRRIDLALERARELVEALPPGSRLALTTSDPDGPRDPMGAPSRGRVDAIAGWVDTESAPHSRPLVDALEEATALLGPDEGRPRVVYAVGDPTRGGLASLPSSAASGIALIPIDVASDASEHPLHVGLGAVTWQAAREVDPRAMRIQVPVRMQGNASEASDADTSDTNDAAVREVEVVLEVDEVEQARTRVSLRPGEQVEAEFTHTLIGDRDFARGRVHLNLDDDAFTPDDARDFWLDADASTQVVVVNGDPSERREFDEVYFLLTALRAADPSGRITVRSVAPDQLESEVDAATSGQAARPDALANTDVLVLANAPAPSAALSRAIEARVREGMGLLVTVGDRVTAPAYNDALGTLLPLRLRGASFAGTAPGRTAARVEGLAPANLAHPAFAGLRGDLDLGASRTTRLFLLEPDARRDVDIALRFASGAPALLTHEVGRGRVALITTSIDRDWSDLALRGGFVSLAERLVAWLGGHRAGASSAVHLVGARVELPGADNWMVSGPDGVDRPSQPAQREGSEAKAAAFGPLRQVGLYEARSRGTRGQAADDTALTRRFAVTVDPRESDTSYVASPEVELDDAVPVEGRTPRWRAFLALAALALAFEAWMRSRAAQRATAPGPV